MTWEPVTGVPSSIIGVSFSSRTEGFVWSNYEVFRTNDGGDSWRSVMIDGPIVRGRPKPIVASSGALWLAIDHGSSWKRNANQVVRIDTDLGVTEVLLASNLRIESMSVSPDDTIWVLGQDVEKDRTELARIRMVGRRAELERVADFERSLTKYLNVDDEEVAMAMTDTVGGENRLMVSKDRGESWVDTSLPEPRIRAYCSVGMGKFWLVGSSGSVYPPR
jgi:hypothetical protein